MLGKHESQCDNRARTEPSSSNKIYGNKLLWAIGIARKPNSVI